MKARPSVSRLIQMILCLPLLAGVALAQKSEGASGEPFPGAPAYWDQLSSAGQMRAYLIYLRENGLLPPAVPRSPVESPDTSLANPQVNNPALDVTTQVTQSESTVSLAGGSNLVAAYNDSGSFLGGVQSFTGYSTSTDSGATWTDRLNVPDLGPDNFGDPVLARDNTTGRIFLSTLAGSTNGINVFRSSDSGLTWNAVANGAPGTTSGNGDKEWITVDNFGGGGNGNVYNAFRDFVAGGGVRFTRSTDGGLTFGPSPGLMIKAEGAFNVQGANVSVGADHAVYVAWLDQSAGAGTANIVKVRKSTDLGATFAAEVNIATLNTTGVNGSLTIPAGYRSSSFPILVSNPAAAANLYVVYNDINVGGTDRGNIFFRQSTDGGATWGAAVQLNQDAGLNVQSFPTLAVRPDGTGLGVMWYDDRSDPANLRFERFARVATVSGTTVTFSHDFVVSSAPSTPVFGADPVVNSVYMGDYDQATADNAFFYDTFLDTRLGTQDVRSARIPVAGPGVPTISFVSSNPSTIANAQNSCTDLFVTVINNGQVIANGVVVSLSSPTPGVTILDSPQPYGNIAAGAQATNATPFRISIDGTFACGTNIVVNGTTNTGDAFSFNIATAGSAYTVSSAAGVAIVPGTVNVGNSGDDVTTNIAIPFPFPFYATPFAAANVSSNGNLQFTSNSTAFSNVCPFPVASMNNLMAAHWDDLRTDGAGGGIFTSTSGVAPNRIFNIEWRAIYFGGTTPLNFEIRLHETTGVIDYIYAVLNGTGGSASVGIQKANGAGGPSNFAVFSCNTAALSTGLRVTFTPPVGCPQGTGACAGCVLTCPGNITGPTDPGFCSAVETYPAPGTSGTCGTVTCSPASGSTFPLGTTTVNCSSSVGGGLCSFTDTVNDLELPTITCPADIALDLPPYSSGQNVDFPPPTVSDNCPGVGAPSCVPASGDLFPAGNTVVLCDVIDAAANLNSCNFNIDLNAVSVLEVPTASTWGLAALALLLAGAALVLMRRQG